MAPWRSERPIRIPPRLSAVSRPRRVKCLHSSFLQRISAVMRWLPTFRMFLKSLSTSALLSYKPDVISAVLANLSARSFPLTTPCPGQQIHRSRCSQKHCMAVCQSAQPIPDSSVCRTFIESVRMMACAICASRWEASHCFACVTASTSMVTGGRDCEGTTVFVHSPSTLLDREPPTRPISCD